VTGVIGELGRLGLTIRVRKHIGTDMTTHTEARFTRYTFAITIALYGALILGGLILGSMVWPRVAGPLQFAPSRLRH
jgi:hypothetical protein